MECLIEGSTSTNGVVSNDSLRATADADNGRGPCGSDEKESTAYRARDVCTRAGFDEGQRENEQYQQDDTDSEEGCKKRKTGAEHVPKRFVHTLKPTMSGTKTLPVTPGTPPAQCGRRQ